jgi:hypothetical protein
MAVIAFIILIFHQIRCKTTYLNVKTNEILMSTNIPVDMDGTNGEDAKNIFETLVVD